MEYHPQPSTNPDPGVVIVPIIQWNRLETRPRTLQFDKVLRGEIHDPLWMMARQFQYGEFTHTDSGTAVLAKAQLNSTKFTRFESAAGAISAIDEGVPMETRIEAEPVTPGIKESAAMGEQWMKMLDAAGTAYNNGINPSPLYSLATYQSIFLMQFPFAVPPTPAINDTAADILLNARTLCNQEAVMLLTYFSGRKINGLAIYNDIVAGTFLTTISGLVAATHINFITVTANLYRQWFESVYYIPPAPTQVNWDTQRLEYQVSCAAPNPNETTYSSPYVTLTTDEFHEGKLDWYSFDVNDDAAPTNPLAATTVSSISQENDFRETTLITLIPTAGGFSGMPPARWWEFEHGAFNFGNVNANTTDIAKVLLAQFALIYHNDWFQIPYKVPVGSISEVGGIVVTDTFGVNTFIARAGSTTGFDTGTGTYPADTTNDWASWSMFNVSVSGDLVNATAPDPRLFLPATIFRVNDSQPLEKVLFVRDDVASCIWAIEKTVTDITGKPREGKSVAKEFTDYLSQQIPEPDVLPSDNDAMISYQLGTEIPEYWIPFVAAHVNSPTTLNRTIQLQRASMPRLTYGYGNPLQPIRPLTSILRPGLNKDDTQSTPYYINDEEMTRAGTVITKTVRKARWYNGASFLWIGRQKEAGRGGVSSGLTFDLINPKTPGVSQ